MNGERGREETGKTERGEGKGRDPNAGPPWPKKASYAAALSFFISAGSAEAPFR